MKINQINRQLIQETLEKDDYYDSLSNHCLLEEAKECQEAMERASSEVEAEVFVAIRDYCLKKLRDRS